MKTVSIIVDNQNFYFPGEGPILVNAESASLKAKEMLQIFSDNNQMVFHVRHKSNKGFEIHKNVEPLPTEKVITKTEVNSFFKYRFIGLSENKTNKQGYYHRNADINVPEGGCPCCL